MRELVVLGLLALAGCNAASASPDAGREDAGAALPDSGATNDAGAGADAAGADAAGTDAASAGDAGAITADEIRAALGACVVLAGTSDYATDSGEADTIPICDGPGEILFWNSDLDVDCDGGQTAICMGDPAYMPETSATTAGGDPIDASTVPFVVIPLPSSRFAYADHAIDLGQIAVVLYGDRWMVGVFADEGPEDIIGEASYAMADALGIDPDPSTGGADSGATFVIFTGAGSRVTAVEDHAEAVAAAMPLIEALVGR
jgi:hypothetical protein